MEAEFYQAVSSRDYAKTVSILLANPDLDFNNWRKESWYQSTALNIAASTNSPNIVELLLRHPRVDVNVKNGLSTTSFALSVFLGLTDVAKVFLRDSRVDVLCPNVYGNTPIFLGCLNGHTVTVKWMLASGRTFDFGAMGSTEDGLRCTPLEIARRKGFSEIFDLLGKFERNPEATRDEIWTSLGIQGSYLSFIPFSLGPAGPGFEI